MSADKKLYTSCEVPVYMWHYSVGGQTFGPFDREQIEEMVQKGTIHQGTMLWAEGMKTWLPAYQTVFKFLFTPRNVPPTLTCAAPTPVQAPNVELKPKKENKLVLNIAAVVGAIIGFFAVKLLPGQLAIRLFGGAIAGCVCGLLPFLVGKKRNPKLAKLSLVCCAVSGMVLGLILALPVAVIFTIVILVTPPVQELGQVSA